MCGIAGIVSFENPFHPLSIKSVNDRLKHRGPDDEGYLTVNLKSRAVRQWIGPESKINGRFIQDADEPVHLAFAHRRLSILDLSSQGHQPMSNADGFLWIVFNGEIYNYIELKAELIDSGYNFKSASDTEVILAAYQMWGKECLKKFNGMWAFVIYDSRQDILFGSRDRFGVKPFYYYFDGKIFAFASEIKALLEFPFVPKKVNPEAVFDFLALGRVESEPESFFKDIIGLSPAQGVEVNLHTKSLRHWTYYELNFSREWTEFKQDQMLDYAYQTENLFKNAVGLRLRSDVSIGSCLSGGLDSSSIVCLINELLRKSAIPSVGQLQNVFTACYKNNVVDESKWAEMVVKATQTLWHRVFPNGQELLKDLEDVVYTQDIPFGSTSIYAQYRVMKLAREAGVKVLMDGQGGDELFGGYTFFYPAFYGEMIKHGKLGRLTLEFRNLGRSPLGAKYLLGNLSGIAASKLLPKEFICRLWQEYKKLGYITPTFLHQFGDRLDTVRTTGTFSLNQMLYSHMTNYNLRSLLRYEDRNSMRFSIEARTPFADDIDLIEYVFKIPSAYKIYAGWSKYLLRKSMERILPQDLCYRRDKIGFDTPERSWLNRIKNELKGYISQDLNAFVDVKRTLTNWDRIFNRQDKTEMTNLWRVVNLAVWKKIFKV